MRERERDTERETEDDDDGEWNRKVSMGMERNWNTRRKRKDQRAAEHGRKKRWRVEEGREIGRENIFTKKETQERERRDVRGDGEKRKERLREHTWR